MALVTGAGRGIGRSIARTLAREGARVLLTARSEDQLNETVDGLRRERCEVATLPLDVTTPNAGDALVDTALARFGGLDIVVNNAGAMLYRPFLETAPDDFERLIDVNFGATVALCRAAGPVLVGQGRGKVINVTSMLASRALAGFAPYVAAKAATLNLTRALALEWAPHDVQVNAIAPGYVETEMSADVRASAKTRDAVIRGIPARRLGIPDEIAALAMYLAGDSSGFVTGASFAIDGGQSARA